MAEAFRSGMPLGEVHQLTRIDPWFLAEFEDLVRTENAIQGLALGGCRAGESPRLETPGIFRPAAGPPPCDHGTGRAGFPLSFTGIHPVFKRVDSCAAEFDTSTAYLYSSYDEECEAAPTDRTKIMVLGGGPNRIGQGIEFDYCCVHASMALREDGYETIMVNCNPETVSTDYDTSDRLYFEPLTLEDVLEVIRVENPAGVIVQYGGQTPLKLARGLKDAGGAHHRHLPRIHPPRRGPGIFPEADRGPGIAAAAEPDGQHAGAGP